MDTHVTLQAAKRRKLSTAFGTLERRAESLGSRRVNAAGGGDVLRRSAAAALSLTGSTVQRHADDPGRRRGVLLVNSSMRAEAGVTRERARAVGTSQLLVDDVVGRLARRSVNG